MKLEYGVATQGVLSFLRSRIGRIAAAAIVTLAVMTPLAIAAKEASVPRKFAGIVVDAKSGKVMYESAADAARYPASVTKVMTLYILFQELEAGNISLSTKMTVSKHAASAVPTKLGLRSGSTISVENAIKALVTLSANDMARVIAEHISGSESAFAKRMTSTARALGMARTTYRNASGLPDPGQITTVRDQAILAIAIYQHFPKYYEYFQTRSFAYGKRVYGNHNRLLGANGVDGIKTGYTNASGFNLMTAARTDGRHIVVIAFGFDKSGTRDAKVRELVKKYLPKSRSGGYLRTAMVPMPGRQGGAPVMVAQNADDGADGSADANNGAVPAPMQVAMVNPAPFPSFRLQQPAAIAAPVQVAAIAPQQAPVPAQAPTDLGITPAVQAANLLGAPTSQNAPVPAERPDVIGAWISDTFALGAAPAPLGQTRPSAPILPPVGVGENGQPIDLMTSGSVSKQAAAQPVPTQAMPQPLSAARPESGTWVVQIGAAPTEAGANSLLGDAAKRLTALGTFQPYVEAFQKNGQTFYRARFTGFGGRDDATDMCNRLKKADMSCLAMQS